MKKYDASENSGVAPIIITNSFDGLDNYLFGIQIKYLIITDSNVATYHLKTLMDYMNSKGMKVFYYIFEAGEKSKSFENVKKIFNHLIINGFKREDCIIGLGGGVVGDTAGFVAATYLRGIKLIHIPTTLLAQIDSSIGGKTAINLDNVKNVVGAFYQAENVFINYSMLSTLSKEEIANGLVEAVVHAVIRDEELFSYIEKKLDSILKLENDSIETFISCNCRIKASVVNEDEKEKGVRAILNFGHTFGHAIEGVCGFKYKHGECVMHGIMGACYISEELGMLSGDVTDKIKKLLLRFNSFTDLQNVAWEDVYNFILHDKKTNNENVRFVLLRNIGDVTVKDIEDIEVIKKAYFRMLKDNKNL